MQPTALERLDTPDGDFLDVHLLSGPDDAPLLILLHGLEGGIRSHYIQGLLGEAKARSWRAAVIVFRSCGAEMNRTRRSYHSGETGDLAFAIDHLASQFPSSQLLLTGTSLGGNVLLKYLGERGGDLSPQVKGAVAVSVPFDLARASRHIGQGFARVYQRNFLRSLHRKARLKMASYPGLVDLERLQNARTMVDFDDAFTAPVHGFSGAEDYYSRSSSLAWLDRISVKTLLLSAIDDPFLPSHVLEDVRNVAARNPNLHVEFTSHGGHAGFVAGFNPLRPAYYLERRTGDFLAREIQD